MWGNYDKMVTELYRGIAQLVEHRSPKPGVGGSSPSAPATFFGSSSHFLLGTPGACVAGVQNHKLAILRG